MCCCVAVDLHCLLDAVYAERRARVCVSVRVYRLGMEPLDWHLLSENVPASVDRLAGGAAPCGLGRSRSRSPCRLVMACAGSALTGSGAAVTCFEEWSWHFDGVVRFFRHGFVLGVKNALVCGPEQRRSIFVAAFADTVDGFRGDEILAHCLQMHLAGHRWEDVEDRCSASCQIARAALREREAAVR